MPKKTTPASENMRQIVIHTFSDIPVDGLQIRNVRLNGRRTSLRLEPPMWQALAEVAALESVTMDEVCTAVENSRPDESGTASAIRVFLMQYFRDQAHHENKHHLRQ